MSALLVEADHVVVGDGTVHSPGHVLVDGNRVVTCGSGTLRDRADVDGATRAIAERARRLGGPRTLAMPGLINGHTHLFQTFLRNLADDLDHTVWLREVIAANSARFTAADAGLAARLGAVEALKGGITTIVDNQYAHADPGNSAAVAAALAATGVRAWVARGSADRAEALAAAAGPNAVRATCESPDGYVAAVEALAADWHGAAGGRISVGVATQAAWLCSDDLAARIATLAEDHGLLFHAHCAETPTSVKRTFDAHGTSDARFFLRSGLVREGSSLVHGVHLDGEEIGGIAAAGGALVHCPVANAYLASGIAPVPEVRRAGAVVALGTDGAASNDRQDGFEVLKLAALLPRLGGAGAGALTARDVLDMAWRGGAASLRREGELGVLAPGALADLAVVSTAGAHLRPLHDPLSALVFNARPDDVRTVVVDGRVVVEDGRCTEIDEEELMDRCDERARALGIGADR